MVTLITRVDRAPVYVFESDRVVAQGDPTPILTAPLWVAGESAVEIKEQSATALLTSATVSNTSDETQYLDVFVDRARPRRLARELVAQDGDNVLRVETGDFAPGYRLPFSIYDFQTRPLLKYSVGPSDVVPGQPITIARNIMFNRSGNVLAFAVGHEQGWNIYRYDGTQNKWLEMVLPSFTIDTPFHVRCYYDDGVVSKFAFFAREDIDDSVTIHTVRVDLNALTVTMIHTVNFPGETMPSGIAQSPSVDGLFIGVNNQGWHAYNISPTDAFLPEINTNVLSNVPDSPNAFSIGWQGNYIAIHTRVGQGSSVSVYDVGTNPAFQFERLPDPPFAALPLRGLGSSVHFRPGTNQFFVVMNEPRGTPPTAGTEYVVSFEIQGSSFSRLPEIPQVFSEDNIKGVFSPDGRYQVFVFDRTSFDTPELYRGITIWDWDSGSPVDVTDELSPLPLIGDNARSPVISDDGRFLAITHTRAQWRIISAIDNMSLTVRGSQQQLLQNPSFEDVTGMEFEPEFNRYVGFLPGWTHTGPPNFENAVATVGEGSQILIRPTEGIRWLSSRDQWADYWDNSELELNPKLYIEQTIPGLTAGQILDLEFDISGDPGAVGAFVLSWNGVKIRDPITNSIYARGNENLGVLQSIPVPPRSTVALNLNKFMLRSGELLSVVSQTGAPLTVACSYLIRVDEELEIV